MFPSWKWIPIILGSSFLNMVDFYLYKEIYITNSRISILKKPYKPSQSDQYACGTLCKVVPHTRSLDYEIYEQVSVDNKNPRWVLVKSSKNEV